MMEAALASDLRPTRSAQSRWRTRQVSSTHGTAPPGLAAVMADFWHSLHRALFDRYRPELHYMRGPGPKWREKHAANQIH